MEGASMLWRRIPQSGHLLLLLLLLLYLAGKAINLLWLRPRRLERHLAKQGIRGPPYRLLHGNIREIAALTMEASSRPLVPKWSHDILARALPFYAHWKGIYGSIFLLWFGSTPRVVVSDPDLIREILVTHSDCYEKYDAHPAIRHLEGRGLVNLKGQEWARRRKLLNPAFHMDNLKLLVPMIARMAAEMVDKWISMSDAEEEVETDVCKWHQILTFGAITKAVFTANFDDGSKAIFQIQCKQMSYAGEACRKVFIPGYRFLPTPKNMHAWKLKKEVNRMLAKLIASRKKKDHAGRDEAPSSTPRDLLSFLVSKEEEDHGGVISLKDMVEECKSFYFAGTHTTTCVLTWSTLMLAMHPEWQEWAREEVLHVCGPRHPPSRDHVTDLKKLGMVLNETLRLYPPVVAMVRRAKADVELGRRYRIPAGTELMLAIMGMHHDPELWGEDWAEFKPTRFADGVARAARHPNSFLPFGLGPRTCIGQNLALLEAKLLLAAMLQRFSVSMSPAYVHAPTVLMLLHPQHGAPVVFRRRPA